MKKSISRLIFFVKNKAKTNPFVLISIGTQILTLFISIFTWKYLEIDDFGLLSILEFYSLICVSVFGVSSEQLIVRDYYKWGARKQKYYLGNILLINWGSSIILFIIITFLSYKFPIFQIPFDLIFLNIIGALLQSSSLVSFSIIRFRSNVKEYIIYMFLSNVLRAIVTFYFVAILKQGIYGLLIAQVYSGIVLLIGNIIYLFPKSKFVFSKRILDETRKLCFPLIPSTLLVNFSAVVLRFVLGKYATLEINGYYNIANKLSSPITSLHTALKVTYVPSIVSLDSEGSSNYRQRIENLSKKYFNILSLITLLIVLFLAEIIKFLLPTLDLNSVKIISFFIVIIYISTCQLYFSYGIFLSRKTSYQFFPNLISILLMLIPGIYLITNHDTYGIFFEEILRVFASSMLAYYYSIKFYRLKNKFFDYLILFVLLLLISQITIPLFEIFNFYVQILIKCILFTYTTFLFIKHRYI